MKLPVLRYYMQSALMEGETRHPQVHLKELGVKWGWSESHSIGDCWFFWMPYGNLNAMPEWLKSEQITVDPMQFWGDSNAECVAQGQRMLAIYNGMKLKGLI